MKKTKKYTVGTRLQVNGIAYIMSSTGLSRLIDGYKIDDMVVLDIEKNRGLEPKCMNEYAHKYLDDVAIIV